MSIPDWDWTTNYNHVRLMPSGEWCAISPQLFTFGLLCGCDYGGYKRRYCYENEAEAIDDMCKWDGIGDPPGKWVKEKPSGRMNPKWATDATDARTV